MTVLVFLCLFSLILHRWRDDCRHDRVTPACAGKAPRSFDRVPFAWLDVYGNSLVGGETRHLAAEPNWHAGLCLAKATRSRWSPLKLIKPPPPWGQMYLKRSRSERNGFVVEANRILRD